MSGQPVNGTVDKSRFGMDGNGVPRNQHQGTPPVAGSLMVWS